MSSPALPQPSVTDAAGYAEARDAAAVAELPARSVLAVTGPLRQKFLHGVLSNDVAGLAPGQGVLAALMDVKGALLAFLRVLVGEDTVWLETNEDRLPLVESTLTHYRVAAPVRFQRRPVAVVSLIGPAAGEVMARAGVENPPAGSEAHQARPRWW
jgi:folate-binding Fe-S cluster repair protein YgfZ